jgi:hypothetical protein
MPTLIHPSGSKKVELQPMTVKQARENGALPQQYVVVEKDFEGHNRQLNEFDQLDGDYILLPRNTAG